MSSPSDVVAAVGEDATAAGDPAVAARELAGCTRPYLIGVRHHSPAIAVAVPRLLEAFDPQVLLVELPAELEGWLPWLADPATTAPVALAGVVDGGTAFYPFADFSPELAAIRWAFRAGIPVVPCDLPLADRGWYGADAEPVDAVPADAVPPDAAPPDGGPADSAPPVTTAADGGWGRALRSSTTGRGEDDLWDRVVEARAPGAEPEALRRAALLVGWALRRDTLADQGIEALDLRREAWMRQRIAEAGAGARRVAAVVGAFHVPALLPGADADSAAPPPTPTASPAASPAASRGEVATSLVPYTYPLLDERSGYPAGIRDPEWQHSVLESALEPARIEAAAASTIVAVCARLRAAGHPAGPAEAREALRVATDLARLRGLPAPGRGELVEAVQLVLAHGEVHGRGRVVATAMERVLVGTRRGALAPGTPRSGLAVAVPALLAELGLPGAGEAGRELRLDPLRSELDRRREVALHRLAACAIPYATATATTGVGGVAALTTRWSVEWSPRTEAMLDVAGVHGVTLAQAADGALRQRMRRVTGGGEPTATQLVEGLRDAASCGLVPLVGQWLTEAAVVLPAGASLTEALAALALLDRLRRGHVPGLVAADVAELTTLGEVSAAIEEAAIRQLDGLAGSTEPADARALAALARRSDTSGVGLRLADALRRLSRDGTPVIAAASAATQVLLGLLEPAALGLRLASWLDGATTPESRLRLRGHLTGLLVVAEPLLEAAGAVLDGLLERVESLPDEAFLGRLPALRGGFDVLGPAARDRLLAVVEERVGVDVGVVDDPRALRLRLLADRAGREALVAAGLIDGDLTTPAGTSEPGTPEPGTPEPGTPESSGDEPGGDDPSGNDPVAAPAHRDPAGSLPVADRWRLILGRPTDRDSVTVRRYAAALDELYGAGRGEGAARERAGRAGREAPFPGVREWSEELAALFGSGIREEVLARAVEGGRLEAALELDPEAVTASVDLLRDVLSLAGGLPESAVARLRPLVARLVAELTRQLATRLRPALTGLVTPRPSRRPRGPLDLRRTVAANLATSQRGEDGRLVLIPERPVFATRARRGVDWRLVLVVDVSGSMENSVIWSALTASVLAGVPALSTHFVAFSTEVVDLTDRVSDPLGLLLEVRVGGGTHIARGLRYARSLVTVPSRTLVAVISDFEEGFPLSGLLAETRALVGSGCTLLGCASLDDAGRPRYSVPVAGQLAAAGMPVAALSPLELARWVGEKVS